MRTAGQLPEWLFAYDNDGVYLNFYTDATIDHTLEDGRRIQLAVETQYPHNRQRGDPIHRPGDGCISFATSHSCLVRDGNHLPGKPADDGWWR